MQHAIIQEIIEDLLSWFKINQEFYSFRLNRTPYTTWISEVCLQQTRLEIALTKIESFLEVFPTLFALAMADEEKVLQAFSGLGYYNRARNIHKGAKYIVNDLDGIFPNSYDLLCKVPSIGPYTAGAIASLCFGEFVPAIDTNVKRIIHRLFDFYYPIQEDINENNRVKFICQDLMLRITFPPGYWNEILMQFGQKICSKSKPSCSICLLNTKCMFYQKQALEPRVDVKTVKKIEALWKIGIFCSLDKKILLQKLENFPLLKGHWGFLSYLTKGDSIDARNSIDNKDPFPLFEVSQKLFVFEQDYFSERECLFIDKFKHSITKYHINVCVYILHVPLSIRKRIFLDKQKFRWCTLDEAETYFVSSLFSKSLNSYRNYLNAQGGI